MTVNMGRCVVCRFVSTVFTAGKVGVYRPRRRFSGRTTTCFDILFFLIYVIHIIGTPDTYPVPGIYLFQSGWLLWCRLYFFFVNVVFCVLDKP